MSTNRPTGCVSGRQGWQWNSNETSVEIPEVRTEATETPARRRPADRGHGSPSVAELQERVSRLEAQLERKEEQTQAIIQRYERLLDEQGRPRGTARADRGSVVDGLALPSLPDSVQGLLPTR